MSSKEIWEEARRTPVAAEVDVLVVGAGPAGIGAAVGAARAGATTLLVEKHGCVGGMLTAGSVLNIRQFNDKQRLIIGGVGAELAERIKQSGGTQHVPTEGGHVRHDPEITKFVAQELVLEASVRVLLHTVVVGAIVRENVLEGALIENKSGRAGILARATVDATGDGDMIWHSRAEFEKSSGSLQPMTLTFIMGGVKCWPETKSDEMRAAVKKALEEDAFPAPRRPALFPMWREGEIYANATRIAGDCTDAWDLTRGEIEGRRQVMGLLKWLRENAPGYEDAYLISTGAQVGLRESRRLVGLYALTREDVLGYRDFSDNIARGAYAVDIHYPGRGGEMVYLEPGKSYGIPYRCLVPQELDGLLAGGRCMSATHDGLGSIRVMATCMATGHGAGVAAALSAKANLSLRSLEVAQLQDALRGQGAIL